MRKSNKTKNILAGIRLKNLLSEKNVMRKEIIIEMNKKGFSALDERKMSDYITGRRPIPTDLAIAISNYLNVDSRFLLLDETIGSFIPKNLILDDEITGDKKDNLSIANLPLFDGTYSDYEKSLVIDSAVTDSFYKKCEEVLSIFGYKLGIHDNGEYEIFDKSGFRLTLSKQELNNLIEAIKTDVVNRVRTFSKEGDSVGSE